MLANNLDARAFFPLLSERVFGEATCCCSPVVSSSLNRPTSTSSEISLLPVPLVVELHVLCKLTSSIDSSMISGDMVKNIYYYDPMPSGIVINKERFQ